MKKYAKIFLIVFVCILALSLAACGNKGEETVNEENGQNEHSGTSEPQHEHVYGEAVTTKEPTYNASGVRTATCSCGATQETSIPSLVPTATVVASGIQTAKNASKQAYDFHVKAEGTVSLYGFNGAADALYDGKYRYDGETDDLKFYRRTSGKLLLNADEYIFTKGSSRMKVKTDTTGKVKKVSVSPKTDDELNMINLPFIGVVNALKADNLNGIEKTSGKYRFKTSLKISTSFAPAEKLLSSVARLGENVTIKNVTFTNPQNGVELFFNVTDEGVLKDFSLEFEVSFPISSVNTKLKVSYAQESSATEIALPNVSSFDSSEENIAASVNNVTTALNAVKNSGTYSLDMTAINDFDAGWDRKAIVDKYIGRMYKNVNGERTDFNHSYKYKAHTEEDGKEGFAYTVGNIQDGTVYEISRKGKNTQTELSGVTADTRFAVMASVTALTTKEVDFIMKKTNADGSVTYTFYTNDAATYLLQQKIADLINSNTGEGVIPVENYFNTEEYKIVTANFTATVKGGSLVSFNADIEVKYTPVGGEYTDSRITLKNTVELIVNDNYDKAADYSAPKNLETKLGSYGLNNTKYYIL